MFTFLLHFKGLSKSEPTNASCWMFSLLLSVSSNTSWGVFVGVKARCSLVFTGAQEQPHWIDRVTQVERESNHQWLEEQKLLCMKLSEDAAHLYLCLEIVHKAQRSSQMQNVPLAFDHVLFW